MSKQVRRLRPWLALIGAVLALAAVIPPAGTAATHYVFAQAVQFAVLAIVAPALIVIGAPWRRLASACGRPGLADQVAARRSHSSGTARSWAVLAAYLVIALGWRLPTAVNALVRVPVLTAAEAVTLIAVGCALWLELVESPPLLPRISRPLRAAFAALPMWALWASAYIMGFSGGTWFTALSRAGAHGLGTVADQEIATAILWAVPALAFVPVVYFALIGWLRDSADPDQELRSEQAAPPAASHGQPPLRPPRGWRLPSS